MNIQNKYSKYSKALALLVEPLRLVSPISLALSLTASCNL